MKYRKEDGTNTTNDDPDRLLWYGLCTYWTDDWDKLKTTSGIPCCPYCLGVGFQITAKNWDSGVDKFNKDNPKYKEFIESVKEKCIRSGITKAYKDFCNDN